MKHNLRQKKLTTQFYFEFSECTEESEYIAPLGNSALTGSSAFDSNHSFENSRLNTVAANGKKGAWSAGQNTIDEFIQADLGSEVKLVRVATQGREDYDQWVTSYHVAYSSDGTDYTFIMHKGQKKLFGGNYDRNTIVDHVFDAPITARYVRLYIQSWAGFISIRWGLYGCARTTSFTQRKIYMQFFIEHDFAIFLSKKSVNCLKNQLLCVIM